MAAVRPQIWIGDRRFALLTGKAMQQLRIGLELRRPAIELAHMAQHHSAAPAHRLHDAANVDIGIAKFAQFADLLAVLAEADNGKSATRIRSVRRAHIEEARAVGQLDDLVDVRLDADVFVRQLCSFVC